MKQALNYSLILSLLLITVNCSDEFGSITEGAYLGSNGLTPPNGGTSGGTGASGSGGASLPSAPTGLQAYGSDPTTNEMNLVWLDQSSNETGFRIERNDGGGWLQLGTAATNIRNYTDTGYDKTKTYQYRVRSVNGAGASTDSSNIVTIPEAPQVLSLLIDVVNSTQISGIQLRWYNLHTNASGLEVWRKAGTGAWTLIVSNLPPLDEFYVDAPTGSGPFVYRVRACQKVSTLEGCSGFFEEVSTAGFQPPPTGLNSSVSGSSVTLTWNYGDMSQLDSVGAFQIYGNEVLMKSTNSKNTSVSPHVAGTNYKIRARKNLPTGGVIEVGDANGVTP